MNTIWTRILPDGKVSKIILNDEEPFQSIGDKPLDTAKCTTRILNINLLTVMPSDILQNSYYLSAVKLAGPDATEFDLQPDHIITSVIGLTATSTVDRLIDVCLMNMTKGEVAVFEIEYEQKETFKIELKLESFEEVKELHQMTSEELLTFASQLKSDGVQLFSEKKFNEAFHKFSKSLKYFILGENKNLDSACDTQQKLMITLKNNLAGCHLACGRHNWEYAIDLCSQVLTQDKNNVKALYRRGVAYLEIQEYEKSRDDLLKAKELDKSNKGIELKLVLLGERENDLKQKYASAMRKMFSP